MKHLLLAVAAFMLLATSIPAPVYAQQGKTCTTNCTGSSTNGGRTCTRTCY